MKKLLYILIPVLLVGCEEPHCFSCVKYINHKEKSASVSDTIICGMTEKDARNYEEEQFFQYPNSNFYETVICE